MYFDANLALVEKDITKEANYLQAIICFKQKVILPDKIYYNKEKMAFRTEKVNAIFPCIASTAAIREWNIKGTNHMCNDLSANAERKGFEPSMQFPAYTLSRRAPSTTRTPL